ncbi:MAG TPA: hypothetical protein VM307_00175 [Egibacteraceae bacterium]|nr:hypothetical protein [Egibacteraceae bacterium]
MTLRLVAVALAALLLAGCGTSGSQTGVAAIQPRDGRSGLHLSGTIDGRHIVVNDGAPVLRLADCDVNDGVDVDLCVFSREINGGFFAFFVENPDVLEAGTIPVVDDACRSPRCDDVTDGAVVELQFQPGAKRLRATSGRLELVDVVEGQRYEGNVSLQFPDGRLSGTMNVIPRPDDDEEPVGP